jgi:hypothetical protein
MANPRKASNPADGLIVCESVWGKNKKINLKPDAKTRNYAGLVPFRVFAHPYLLFMALRQKLLRPDQALLDTHSIGTLDGA